MEALGCMFPWELRCVLGGNRFESGIIILYSASEQGYLVLALYKHALLYIIENPELIDNFYQSQCVYTLTL